MGACGSSSASSCPASQQGESAATGCAAGPDKLGNACPPSCQDDCGLSVGSLLDMAKTPGMEKKVSTTWSNFDPKSNFIGYACRKGRKPCGRQPNQDSWCVHRVPGKLSAYGVFDGHGEKGHMISDYVRQSLTKEVLKAIRNGSEPTDKETTVTTAKSLEEGYRQVQRGIMSKPHLGVQLSGTTATVVVHDHARERLTISHVGDSTAVLVKKKVGSAHELEGVALTRDHKPDLEDETQRIERAGGRVTFDGYCHRVVKKHGSGPGINMSRSLGDGVAHRVCGVSAEPEVSEHRLSRKDHALLVCSDGVWEVITPQEAADILKDYGQWQAMAAAKHLADEATRRWLAGTNGQMTDDITAVVAFLHTERTPELLRADTCTTTAPSSVSGCTTSSETHSISPSQGSDPNSNKIATRTGSWNSEGHSPSNSDDAHFGRSASGEAGEP